MFPVDDGRIVGAGARDDERLMVAVGDDVHADGTATRKSQERDGHDTPTGRRTCAAAESGGHSVYSVALCPASGGRSSAGLARDRSTANDPVDDRVADLNSVLVSSSENFSREG
jgi:hypothetical protein